MRAGSGTDEVQRRGAKMRGAKTRSNQERKKSDLPRRENASHGIEMVDAVHGQII